MIAKSSKFVYETIDSANINIPDDITKRLLSASKNRFGKLKNVSIKS